MIPRIGMLPPGARGFDANARVGPEMAKKFYAAGYRFVVRYVRRSQRHDFDISVAEMLDLLAAGLGVMLVQHVAPEGWTPSASLGRQYGLIAANEAHDVGYPIGGTVWCDLEGVARGVPESEVIDFCRNWFIEVATIGYTPGLYVGYGAGISAESLYRALPFEHYWGAYNLDAENVPAVRGLQMKQLVARAADKVPGCPFEIDVDVIMIDARGGTPLLLLPS